MAIPPAKVYRQELPPKGGFPAIKYAKYSYNRGPAGIAIIFGLTAMTGAGLWYAMEDNLERE